MNKLWELIPIIAFYALGAWVSINVFDISKDLAWIPALVTSFFGSLLTFWVVYRKF